MSPLGDHFLLGIRITHNTVNVPIKCMRGFLSRQRRDFLTVHGAEELSRINSSPARAAGEVVGKT